MQKQDIVGVNYMELYDYQKVDIEKVKDLKAVLNANKMGYGKTVEAIMLMQMWQCKRVLVVCPKAVLEQWASEIKKWTGRDSVICPKIVTYKAQIVIINYDKLANGTSKFNSFTPGKFLQQFLAFSWDLVICDEVHRIKNREAKTSRALEKIPAQRKIGMSGTPILNKPNDLFSILHWLDTGYPQGNYWAFVNKFCKVERGPFGNTIVGLTENKDRQEELVHLLEPFTIRNPDLVIGKGKRITYIPLSMEGKQKKLYENIKRIIVDALPDNCSVLNGMSQIIRLMQTTSNPKLFDIDNNVKFDWIVEMCNDNPETKFVIYSHFAETVKALAFILGNASVPYIGEMDGKQRTAALRCFIDGPVQVLVGTIGAMGQGIDGLQAVCCTEIFIDRDWSPALNEQAEDRLNRIGQKNLVDVYVLECIGTVDKYVGKVNLKKIEDIRRVLDENIANG